MPGVPQLGRRGQEGPGPLVAVVLGQVAAAAEVLPGEGVPGGDHVPRRPAAGQVVEAGELAGHLVRLVERGVDRAGQPEVLGDRGQGGQDREGVGAADHVEVVDLPVLLAQPQSFGEEQEVELASLGGLGELAERVELDVAAGGGVAPHGRVVHAGKVRGQVDLLASWFVLSLGGPSGGGVAVGGAGQAEQPAQRVAPRRRSRNSAAALQLGDQAVGDAASGRAAARPGAAGSRTARRPASPAAGRPARRACRRRCGRRCGTRPRRSSSRRCLAGDGRGLGRRRGTPPGRRRRAAVCAARPARGLLGPDLRHDLGGVGRVARGDEPDVGRAARSAGTARRRGRGRRRPAGPAAAAA